MQILVGSPGFLAAVGAAKKSDAAMVMVGTWSRYQSNPWADVNAVGQFRLPAHGPLEGIAGHWRARRRSTLV